MTMVELKNKELVTFTISSNESLEDASKKNRCNCDQDFEPYLFGCTENPIGFCGAVLHLIRSTIGTGILVLPFAFKQVGYVVGVLGCVCIGILYMNTVHALLFTEYELCKRLKVRNLTFVRVVEETFRHGPNYLKKFGPFFKYLMYFYYVVPIGNAIYLIIIASNMKGVYESFFEDKVDFQYAISIIIFPETLLCLIPKLKFLVPLSTLTNIFTMVNIGIILFYSTNLGQVRHDILPVGSIQHIPQFFALVLQSLFVTGIILPLKNDMRKPRHFAMTFGVMNVSFSVLILLYTVFGLVGYLNYGEDVKDNILSNLPQNTLLTITVYILYSLALSVTYTLIFYVYFDTLSTNILQGLTFSIKYQKLSQFVMRIGLSTLAYIMAVAVPNFALFTSLAGTIGIILEIALPAILQTVLLWTSNYSAAIIYRNIFKNSLIISLSFFMFVMSLKNCVSDVLKIYN